MASFVYNTFWDAVMRGNLDIDGSTFKVMLTTSTYAEDKDLHDFRNDVTNEVTGGGNTGYTAGGATATITIGALNTAADSYTLTLQGATWTTVNPGTLVARKAVYYQNVGTAATDRLVAIVDFGTDQTASNGGALTLPSSTITLTNS